MWCADSKKMASSSVEIAAEADRLHYGGGWRDAYEYLKPHCDSSTDPEVLWRLLRSFYRVGKFLAKDQQEIEYLAQKGHDIMERALKLHENNFHIQKVTCYCARSRLYQQAGIGSSCRCVCGFPTLSKHYKKYHSLIYVLLCMSWWP